MDTVTKALPEDARAVNALNCLRCTRQALAALSVPSAETTFFECPSCGRHYAHTTGRPLTFRWGHPISLALYEFSRAFLLEVVALLKAVRSA